MGAALRTEDVVASPPDLISLRRSVASCHEVQFYSNDALFLDEFTCFIGTALKDGSTAVFMRRGSSLWSEAGQQAIASLSLTRYTAERRTALQSLYRHLEEQMEDLNRKVEELAWQRPQAQRLMTHPGVGPITALATETFLGEPKRFVDGKAVASYVD